MTIQKRPQIAKSITELIGGTPLLRLNQISEETGVEVLAKLEYFNPLGSVKDRIGFAMIDAAEKQGLIQPGLTTLSQPVEIRGLRWRSYLLRKATSAFCACRIP